MSASLLSYSFLIKHNRFIVYLINGNFLLQYTIYIIYRFLFLYYTKLFQSFKDHKALMPVDFVGSSFVEREIECKITAFFWYDQIFEQLFCIFFVTYWFSSLRRNQVFREHCLTMAQKIRTSFDGSIRLARSCAWRSSFFLESGCKITAFFWHDQIFMHFFSIFFVSYWKSVYVYF